VTSSLLGAGALRAVLARHGVVPNKALGQNFVIDPNTIRRVVDVAALRGSDRVLEIGAGAGSLTLALAGAAAHVTAVELDRTLLPVLEETLAGTDNVAIRRADALDLDLASIGADHLVGNLPYGIATTLVVKALTSAPAIASLTVMTQKEVGERFAARPGTTYYGIVSVLVAFHARARVALRVSRRAFYPVPGVESVVVRIVRRERLPDADPETFARVVRAAFSQRRKTMRNALASVAGSAGAAEVALARAAIDPGVRAETVGVEGFVDLTRALAPG
jgi:16S rRNA (adenine1518-N6/adenine1519-N6)-dimethyltransferase